MCTTNKGTIFKESGNITDEINKNAKVDAAIGFSVDLPMYKQHDFRCLKPSNKTKPEKWPHYEMEGFRRAKTKAELQNVKVIKYDNFFFNWEDPKVLKQMSDPKKGSKLWKQVYGFDYVDIAAARWGCYRYCFKAEKRRFARRCKKKKGLFKCCLSR